MVRGHCGENDVAGRSQVGVGGGERRLGFGGALADLRGALNIVGGDVFDAGLAQAFGEVVASFAEADESDSWGVAHLYSVRCFLWGLPRESGIAFIPDIANES